MKSREFYLPKEAIDPDYAPGRGSCIASDMITVEGYRVGYMYREPGTSGGDSGWRFFSGAESEEYTDNPDNFTIYSVNTIANYDSDIIPFLDAPVGSAFERRAATATFIKVERS